MAAGDLNPPGIGYGGKTGGDPAAPATNGRNLNSDQHAGSGPALTSSGLDLKTGDVTAYAGTNDLAAGGGDAQKAVIQKTFDKVIKWRLQNEPMYRQFANVNVIDQAAFPGSAVTLFRTGAQGLPLAVTPLSEYADPDAQQLPALEDKMLVTVNEYGASTVVTSRLKRYSWTEIDPMQAEYVARAMRETVDAIYANAIYSNAGGWLGKGARQAFVTAGAAGADSTIELTAGTTQDKKFTVSASVSHGLLKNTKLGEAAATAATGYIDSAVIRRIVAHFRSLGVAPKADGNYVGLITPDQAVHLREETSVAGWRYPHLDGSWNGNILNGTVGIYENVRFLESSAFYGMDKGDSYGPTDTFGNKRPKVANSANCIFMGAEGIADVVVEEPHAVVTPTTDKFGRLFGLGFIGTFGATVYDPNAILLVAAKSD